MVWIHGGAFVWGAGDTPWYDGTHVREARRRRRRHDQLPARPVRLPAPRRPVRRRSRVRATRASSTRSPRSNGCATASPAFGGDPDDVTIFGESAGADSVGTLLGMPAARGLVPQARSPQSGAASWIATPERATEIATRQSLDRPRRRARRPRRAAGQVDRRDPRRACRPFVENGGSALPFQPVVDGVVLPEPPLDAIAAGNAAGVHVLTGTNDARDDAVRRRRPGARRRSTTTVIARARSRPVFDGADALVRRRTARAVPDATPAELWLELATDGVFRIPAIALAEAQLRARPGVDVPASRGSTPVFGGVLRSTHALEIPFVFDTARPGRRRLLHRRRRRAPGASPTRCTGPGSPSPATGDPSHPGLPAWPALRPGPAGRRCGSTPRCEVLDDPDGRAEPATSSAARSPRR